MTEEQTLLRKRILLEDFGAAKAKLQALRAAARKEAHVLEEIADYLRRAGLCEVTLHGGRALITQLDSNSATYRDILRDSLLKAFSVECTDAVCHRGSSARQSESGDRRIPRSVGLTSV